MNKEYRQWKRILAHPLVLIGMSLFITIFFFVLVSFLLNFLQLMITHLNVLIKVSPEAFINEIKLNFNWSLLRFNQSFSFSIWIYLFLSLWLIYKLSRRTYNMRNSFKDINKGTKGTERFMTEKEVVKQLKAVKMDDNEYEGESGVPLYRINDTVYIDTSNTNSSTLGSTQSGKTELFSYPTLDLIMRAKIKDSVVVTDLKGDMLRKTKAEFERFGYLVYCLNLIEPEHSIRYNPLAIVWKYYAKKDYSKAQLYANDFSFSIFHNPNAKDPTWQEASIALLNAMILMVCEIAEKNNKPEYVNLYALTSLLEELGGFEKDAEGEEYSPLDEYFNSLPNRSVARKQYATVKFSPKVTRGGILFGTMGKLKNYTYDSIAALTAENDLDFEDIAYGEKPVAIFLVYPDWSDANYSILASFLSQMNAVLSEKATLSRTSKLPRRVRLLLEEIFNLPAIKGLSRQMNIGLQRGIVHHLVFQSNVQGDDVYGEKQAKGIRGACGNQYFIMADEGDDAQAFSEKLGDKTVITVDRHGDPLDLDKSYGEKEDGRSLLNKNELMNLMPGEWVVYRTKKRRDLLGRRVKAYPIYANIEGDSDMKHAYEYLSHRFYSDQTLAELNLGGNHKEIDLNDIVPTLVEETEPVIVPPKTQKIKEEYREIDELERGVVMQENIVGEALTPNEATKIEDVLSKDKLFRLNRLIEVMCSPQEQKVFSTFTTVEEISDFLDSVSRLELKEKVELIINVDANS